MVLGNMYTLMTKVKLIHYKKQYDSKLSSYNIWKALWGCIVILG